MTPYKQLYRHDPDKGIYGDCWRTCYACLLDIPPYAVPHPFADSDNLDRGWAIMRRFMEGKGYGIYTAAYQMSDIEEFLNFQAVLNPGITMIMLGQSKNLVGHCVLIKDGIILHDPSLDNSGIIGPLDGHFHIELLVPLSKRRSV